MGRKKGMLICFTGIDGSGKTTVAKNVTTFLKEKDLPAVYVYGRLKPFLAKPLIFIGNKMFLRNYNITENYSDYSGKKKNLFSKHRFILKIYLYILLLDYILQLWIKVKIPLISGKVIVCDRYIYDTVITDIAVDMNFSKEQVVSLIGKCFLLIPKPNVAFVVDVPEEIAYQRKSDVPDKRYLNDRRSFYLQVARYYNYNMTIIDGSKKPEDILFDAKSEVEKCLQQ